MSRRPGAGRPVHYEIRVRGVLDRHWSGWFDGLQVSSDEPGQTLMSGPVIDQAGLHGLLAKVRDLGLPLLSVQQISPGQTPEEDARPAESHPDTTSWVMPRPAPGRTIDGGLDA